MQEAAAGGTSKGHGPGKHAGMLALPGLLPLLTPDLGKFEEPSEASRILTETQPRHTLSGPGAGKASNLPASVGRQSLKPKTRDLTLQFWASDSCGSGDPVV